MLAKTLNKTKKSSLAIVLILALTTGLTAVKSVGQQELAEVLEKSAQYCEKLKERVFHFLCYEKIIETVHKSLQYPEKRRGLKNFLEGFKPNQGGFRYEAERQQRYKRRRGMYSDRNREIKRIYLNEYQIIKIGDRVKERRTLRKFNGKKMVEKVPGLQTVIYSYKNALTPIHFFAAENQGKYLYRILKKERVMGCRAYVIEIKAKGDPGEETGENKDEADSILVKAWVDAKDFSILKFNVFPGAFSGADYLLASNVHEKYNVKISDTHYFGKVKEGIRYPSKTEIYISYNEEPKKLVTTRNRELSHGARIYTKLSTVYFYKDYIFYTVSVENPVFH